MTSWLTFSLLYMPMQWQYSRTRELQTLLRHVSRHLQNKSSEQKLRRKQIDKEIFAYKERHSLEPLDVPLYERFDAPRRQKTGASLRLKYLNDLIYDLPWSGDEDSKSVAGLKALNSTEGSEELGVYGEGEVKLDDGMRDGEDGRTEI
jgi:hypothetical protein